MIYCVKYRYCVLDYNCNIITVCKIKHWETLRNWKYSQTCMLRGDIFTFILEIEVNSILASAWMWLCTQKVPNMKIQMEKDKKKQVEQYLTLVKRRRELEKRNKKVQTKVNKPRKPNMLKNVKLNKHNPLWLQN